MSCDSKLNVILCAHGCISSDLMKLNKGFGQFDGRISHGGEEVGGSILRKMELARIFWRIANRLDWVVNIDELDFLSLCFRSYNASLNV